MHEPTGGRRASGGNATPMAARRGLCGSLSVLIELNSLSIQFDVWHATGGFTPPSPGMESRRNVLFACDALG
jgi:hypothetical protein